MIRSISAAAVFLGLCQAAAGGTSMQMHGPAFPPPAFNAFCREQPGLCSTAGGQEVVGLTAARLEQLKAVNSGVNRRIREQTVLHWQQQSRLMCRIPLLRGHDAQVLVACDITEPEQVATMTPDALFAVIEPFVKTIEGQRLLRSSNTPDLEEVSDWIHWARHARTLRAA